MAVFGGPSLCKITTTDDESTFLKVEFASKDGPPLLVTAMKAEQALSMSIQMGSGGGVASTVSLSPMTRSREAESKVKVAGRTADNVKESVQLASFDSRLDFGCYIAWKL